MFSKVNVDILGMVENMAWFECPEGNRYHIFGDGGGVREAERLKIPLLGQIPIDQFTRECADNGRPISLMPAAESPVSEAFSEAASILLKRLDS